MEIQVLGDIAAEIERRQRSRELNRHLRDTNDPFFLPENQFRKYYRLSREAARDVFLHVQLHLEDGRRATRIPAVIKFMTTLHFFAHGSYQKSVGKDQHSALSQSAVSNCLHQVADIIIRYLGNVYIKFPRRPDEIISTKTGFFEKYHFPGVVGCIDGTFVAIFPPPADDPVYPGNIFINRKNFHALNVLIVCDSNLKILSMNARYPGSVHDSAVYMMSGVKQILHQNYENGDRLTWLLGDSGYPLEPYLLTPIEGAEPNTPEGRYTQAHRMTRNCIERCIGTLKSYFRCLLKDRVLHYAPPFAAKIVYCCGILHNVMRQWNIVDEDIEVQYDDEWNNENDAEGENLLQQGQRIRNNVIERHFLL